MRAGHAGGVMAVLEETIPPGALITPHTHQNDVWVHVLTGQIGVLAGRADSLSGAGRVGGIVEVLTPGGSERWFEEIAELQPDDEEGFRASCLRHGIQFHPGSPWLRELRERNGL